MKYRNLGNTGIKVSEVGFGAWQLGNSRDWSGMEDKEAIRLVHEALDQGCNFFDTAPNYGGGNSERLLGEALAGRRADVVINTKFGHHPDQIVSFDKKLLRNSIEESLERLKTDYLDAVVLHNPPFPVLSGKTGHFDELEKLKGEGKIRAYGASVDSGAEMQELMKNSRSQVMEVMFNIFHQEPKHAFWEAAEKGVGLIIKVPLDSGWLSGKYDETSRFDDIRSRWDRQQIEKRTQLLKKVKTILGTDEPVAQEAIRFILGFEEVSTVIPGAKSLEQLSMNINASERGMSLSVRNRLEKLWEEELGSDPLKW